MVNDIWVPCTEMRNWGVGRLGHTGCVVMARRGFVLLQNRLLVVPRLVWAQQLTNARPHSHRMRDATRRDATRRAMQCKQMGPVVINGSVHTARKQHQRICIRICVRVASRVLCEWDLMQRFDAMRSVWPGPESHKKLGKTFGEPGFGQPQYY